MRIASLVLGSFVTVLAGAATLAACAGEGFDPASRVDSVRLFAVRADKPYAKPGEVVTLEGLTTDARKDRPRPLKLYWIPVACLNPRDDLYYLCFAALSGGGTARLFPAGPATVGATDGSDAGAPSGTTGGDGGGLGGLPPGLDLTAQLVEGPTFSFRMPDDAVQERSGVPPYGVVFVFNVACAGRVVLGSLDAAKGPQQLPILCADENGNPLPASDYVIGISRVYSYADRVNTNPVIDAVTLDGQPIDPAVGVTLDRCTTGRLEECKGVKFDVRVPEASWEDNATPGNEGAREQIWVDYYSDRGALQDEARLLFDTRSGRVSGSEVTFRPFEEPGEGHLWAVVHDNRGGVSWSVVPVRVK